MSLVPPIIRWGLDASMDVLRHARCSRCGHKGVTLQAPSWVGSKVGVAPFPVEEMGGRPDPPFRVGAPD